MQARCPQNAGVTAEFSTTLLNDGSSVDPWALPLLSDGYALSKDDGTCIRIDVTFRGTGDAGSGSLTSSSESAGEPWITDPFLLIRQASRGSIPEYPPLHRLWLWDAETVDSAVASTSSLAPILKEVCSMEGVYNGNPKTNNKGPLTGRKFSALLRFFSGGWKLLTAVAPGGDTNPDALAFPFWLRGACSGENVPTAGDGETCNAGRARAAVLLEEVMASESRSCALGHQWCLEEVNADSPCTTTSAWAMYGSTEQVLPPSDTTTTTTTAAAAAATTTTTTAALAGAVTTTSTGAPTPTPVPVPGPVPVSVPGQGSGPSPSFSEETTATDTSTPSSGTIVRATGALVAIALVVPLV